MIELLKVKTSSKPNAVATAIANILKSQGKLKVQAVGAGSINQAVKSLAIARSHLVLSGNDLTITPVFKEVIIDSESKTAICFITNLI